MGELMVIFHLPSTDMHRTSLDEAKHLSVPNRLAQGLVDDNVMK
jgi:hypothetical protein